MGVEAMAPRTRKDDGNDRERTAEPDGGGQGLEEADQKPVAVRHANPFRIPEAWMAQPESLGQVHQRRVLLRLGTGDEREGP